MTENYDELTWDISDIPIGCSTPDDLFEYSFKAETQCPDCGNPISGVAQYWSKYDEGIGAWLERIDYEPCECSETYDEDEEYEDEDDKLMDNYFKSIS